MGDQVVRGGRRLSLYLTTFLPLSVLRALPVPDDLSPSVIRALPVPVPNDLPLPLSSFVAAHVGGAPAGAVVPPD